jgi:hypothetical protein
MTELRRGSSARSARSGLRRGRLLVPVGQDVQELRKAAAQALDVADGRGGRRGDLLRELGAMVLHLAEQVEDRGCMGGLERGFPFQGAQQLLADRMVVRMELEPQAGLVERLGLAVKSAEQSPPIGDRLPPKLTTPSGPAAVEAPTALRLMTPPARVCRATSPFAWGGIC